MTIWYESAGGGDAVVFLPAGMLDSRQWDEQFALASRTHRAVRLDFRGSGKTPAASEPFLAYEDVAEVLRELGIQQAIVVGNSLGGRVAIDLAIAHPELVASLLLVAPGISGYVLSDETRRELAALMAVAGDIDRFLAAFMAHPTMAPTRGRAIVERMLRDNQPMFASFAFYRELEPPAIGRIAELRQPHIVVTGSDDHRDLIELADSLGGTRIVVPNARHLVNFDQPERFNEILLRVLTGSNATASSA